MNTALIPLETRWVRAHDGLLAGVCEGLGRRFGVDPWILRLIWLASIMALGTGLLLYVILAMALPREDRLAEAYDKRFLGVCARLSRRTGLEVGLVRALTLMLAIPSFGLTLLAYVVIYFVMPDEHDALVY